MKVVFVQGPTATGKSGLALELAQRVGGAIVNCDSIQIYQGLVIGSAFPSESDFKLVPHLLYGVIPVGETITTGQYRRLFFKILKEIESQYEYVFVVGGSGFWFQALEKGMYEVPELSESQKQEIVAGLKAPDGANKFYDEILKKDPSTNIKPNDLYRIGRAMEIMRATGKTPSEHRACFQEQPFPWPLLKLGLTAEKEVLLPRVQLRTRDMLHSGLLTEVRGLLVQGLVNWAPLNSVGYKQAKEFLLTNQGMEDLRSQEVFESLEALETKIVQSTMQLIKKQKTWFKRDKQISWVQGDWGSQKAEILDLSLKSLGFC